MENGIAYRATRQVIEVTIYEVRDIQIGRLNHTLQDCGCIAAVKKESLTHPRDPSRQRVSDGMAVLNTRLLTPEATYGFMYIW